MDEPLTDARDRPQEHALGLGALRSLLPALRGHRRRRVRLPLAFIDRIWITELDDGPPGRRLAVKDLFDTAGIRTTYGSVVFDDHVPVDSAEAVERLERAGWTNVGKTNLHEFAYGVTSQNLHYGSVPNPAFPDRTPVGRREGPQQRSWSASPTALSERTPAARSAFRPRVAASPGSSRPTGSFRSPESSRSPVVRPCRTDGS